MFSVNERTKDNIGNLLNSEYIKYMVYLFEETSKDVFPETINVPNEAWFEYIDLVYKVCGQGVPKKIVTNCLPKIYIDNVDYKGIMMGVSGGSDSTTYACYFMDKGYHVVLYSLFNLNRYARSENRVVENFANYFNLELDYDRFNFAGLTKYIESPVKNHLIAAYMIPHMVDRGIVNMSEGLFVDDLTGCSRYVVGVSDFYDVFRLFEKAIQFTFPQFRFKVVFKSSTHRAAYLVKYHKDIINLYQTCLYPDRLRSNLRKRKEEKYHLNSPENRCMSCRKCALDYLFLGLFGYLNFNNDYVKNEVKNIFLKSFKSYIKGVDKDVAYSDIIREFIDFNDYERYHSNPSLIDSDIEEVFKVHNKD